MNKFFTGVIAVFLFAFCGYVTAKDLPIYQISDAKGTFIQVPLTHYIYTYTQTGNLQNLVVLDAEKNSLPYRLVTIAPQVQKIDPKIISTPLAFFPIAIDASPETLRKLHSYQTKVQGNKIQTITSDAVLDNKTPEFYLVDVNKLGYDIDQLSIDWDVQPDNQYLEIELEATSNLQDWFSIGRATLVQINQQDQVLKHNHIALNIPQKNYEFLRLKVLRGAEKLHLTSISAEQIKATSVNSGAGESKGTIEIWNLSGKLSANQNTVYAPGAHSKSYPVAAWEFVRTESTPLATIGIDLGTRMYGDSAKIFSRNSENQTWELQYQGILFNALVGDQWQKSDAINVHHNDDKFWRLELNETAKNDPSPTLVFSWKPTQLQIIANGKPPYVLALGRDNNAGLGREQVFNQIIATRTPEWVAADLIKLDVQPEALLATTQKATDWKQWLFWAALILAVLVLLLFSLRLFKQLKTSGIPE